MQITPPENEMMTLTTQAIHEGATANKGWKRAQLDILGVAWPPVKGWMRKVAGRKITKSRYQEFCDAGKRS